MIRIDALHKSYGGSRALEPLSLEVASGEVVALVGPNGAGKSTTLRVLAGLIQPSGGRASIGGHDVVRDRAAARRQVGYLSQHTGAPLSTIVGDLTALVARVRGIAVTDAVESLTRSGLEDRLECTLGELSGGQRQRAMVTLATLGPVTALLLDEPSISLDSEGSEHVRLAIRQARARGTAVLFASHHLHDVAVLADRIVVMVEGRVVAQGTLSELALAAGVPCDAGVTDSPIERIYRVLVRRGRDSAAARPAIIREVAA
ncbi:MAG TPA: ABC transporter ATP-binding protein [Gemmatimonadales bacterium]